jgi:hypothetical protein
VKKIITFLIGCISCTAFSLTLDSVNIFGEEISGCNLSMDSVDASIASAMRFNRVGVSDKSTISAYHQITALEIAGGCAVNVKFQIYFNSFVAIPPENKKYVFLRNEICAKGALLTGQRFNLQTRVNDILKEYVDLCINEFSKK